VQRPSSSDGAIMFAFALTGVVHLETIQEIHFTEGQRVRGNSLERPNPKAAADIPRSAALSLLQEQRNSSLQCEALLASEAVAAAFCSFWPSGARNSVGLRYAYGIVSIALTLLSFTSYSYLIVPYISRARVPIRSSIPPPQSI
jgi:hypothetical protein